MTPGLTIRGLRKACGFTHEDVSRLTGIPASAISAIELDKLDLGVRRGRLLAAALGVEPADILFPNGYIPPKLKAKARRVRAMAEKLLAQRGR